MLPHFGCAGNGERSPLGRETVTGLTLPIADGVENIPEGTKSQRGNWQVNGSCNPRFKGVVRQVSGEGEERKERDYGKDGRTKYMAEREGFEPPIPVKVCPLSRRIVSTTHAPLRRKRVVSFQNRVAGCQYPFTSKTEIPHFARNDKLGWNHNRT